MRLPRDRGLLSKHVLHALQTGGSLPSGLWADHGPVADLLHDEDVQLTLWVIYELHYRGFDDAPIDREWDPALLELRAGIEAGLERELRAATAARLRQVPDSGDVGEQLLAFVAADDGPSSAAYLQRSADRAQFEHFLRQRSIYHLKEADPHTFVLPRIDGAAKVVGRARSAREQRDERRHQQDDGHQQEHPLELAVDLRHLDAFLRPVRAIRVHCQPSLPRR